MICLVRVAFRKLALLSIAAGGLSSFCVTPIARVLLPADADDLGYPGAGILYRY